MGECVGLVRFSNMYCFRVYHGLNFSVEGRETSRAFVLIGMVDCRIGSLCFMFMSFVFDHCDLFQQNSIHFFLLS